jgi:hypothetical protein
MDGEAMKEQNMGTNAEILRFFEIQESHDVYGIKHPSSYSLRIYR